MGSLIGLLIIGLIIGLLGKFVAPGDRDNIPLWLTAICGVVGVLIGNYLYMALFTCAEKGLTPNCTNGVDWWRWVWGIVASAVLVVIAATLTGRSRKTV